MVSVICPLCSFTLDLKEPLTTKQKCPVCEEGILKNISSEVRLPTDNETLVPDVHRTYEWCIENLDSDEFFISMKSLYIHCLKAFRDSYVHLSALEFIEITGLLIMRAYNDLPLEKKSDFVKGWLDNIYTGLMEMSRTIRLTHKPPMKLNGELEKEFLLYKNLTKEQVDKLKNRDWE